MSKAMMNAAHMMAAASAEAAFSCANYAAVVTVDAMFVASILFAILGILGLRLRSLIRLLDLRSACCLKAAVSIFA